MSANEEHVIRFAVGPWHGRYSSLWRIWSNPGDDNIFLGVISLLQQMKISLHRSGKFRVAFTKEYHEKLIANDASPAADRAFFKWEKGFVGEKEIRQVLDIHFPLIALQNDFLPELKGRRQILRVTPQESSIGDNDTVTAKITFHRLHPENKAFLAALRRRNIIPIYYTRLATGEFSSVVFTYSKKLPLKIRKEDVNKYGAMYQSMFTKSGETIGNTICGQTMQFFDGKSQPPAIMNIGGISVKWATKTHFEVNAHTVDLKSQSAKQ